MRVFVMLEQHTHIRCLIGLRGPAEDPSAMIIHRVSNKTLHQTIRLVV